VEAEQESQRSSLSSEFEDQSEGSGKEEAKTKREVSEESPVPLVSESESKVESEGAKDEAESTEDKVRFYFPSVPVPFNVQETDRIHYFSFFSPLPLSILIFPSNKCYTWW